MKKSTPSRVFRLAMMLITCLAQPLILTSSTYAAYEDWIDDFTANNIIYYNPEGCGNNCKVSCVGSNGSNVTVLGDSILNDEATKAKLKEKLSGLSTDADNYDAVVGRAWDAGVEQAKKMNLKDIVIFEHATNNEDGITAKQLNDLLDVMGNTRTVILVTPYKYGDATVQAKYDKIAELFKQTATTNQQIKIADWAQAAKNANVTFGSDPYKVHPQTDEERQLYVDTLTAQISGSCNSGEAIVSGTTAEEKIWSGLISMGIDEYAAAGIMGNIIHEGLMNPAQWEVGGSHEADWGKTLDQIISEGNKNRTGFGLVAFTALPWYEIVNAYYKEVAPDLLSIVENPNEYSINKETNSKWCDGNCFLKKVDDATANRMYSVQLTIVGRAIRGEYKDYPGLGKTYEGVLNLGSPEEAAVWWLKNYEIPADMGASVQKERGDSAREYYEQFHGKVAFSGTSGGSGTTSTNCNNSRAATAFKKYNFTDGQLRGIISIAENENGGSMSALKTELSIIANLFEYYGPGLNEPDNEEGLIHYIRRNPSGESGWFSTYKLYNENYTSSYGNEALEAARDIYNNGNRTLPQQILEHDCFLGGRCTAGISWAENNGVKIDINNRDDFKRGVTVLHQGGGDLDGQYIFWDWADPENKKGDPFGYFEDNPPDGDFSAASTAAATSAKTSVNIQWDNDGWITSGMDGYTKQTPDSDPKLENGDPSPTLDYLTNRPKDGKVGPNKITLHSTEGVADGLNVYPHLPKKAFLSHFTINLKTKKVWQHLPINHPASGISGSADSGGWFDQYAGVQIEIVGFSTDDRKNEPYYLNNTQNFGDEEWKYLAKLLVGISDYTGVKLDSTLDWSDPDGVRMTDHDEYIKYEGIIGHMHAPKDDHIDPGNIWDKVKKALNSYTVGTSNGTCDDTNSWHGDFPHWFQCRDQEWSELPYGSCGTICSSGCGCVSFAMMATALTGVEHKPDEVCTYAGDQGMHICGTGSSWSLPKTISEHFGLEHEDLNTPSIDEINTRLREGWMIWTCGGGPEPFTNGGHCIGVRGITSSGKWLIADSWYDEEDTLTREWDPATEIYPYMHTFQAIRKK